MSKEKVLFSECGEVMKRIPRRKTSNQRIQVLSGTVNGDGGEKFRRGPLRENDNKMR